MPPSPRRAGDLGKSSSLVRSGDQLGTAEVFEFVRANQVKWNVATLCRILGVSPSGYYAWRNRPPSWRRIEDEKLTVAIKEWHARSRGTYGAPRVLEDLRDQGHRVGCKRVARLMRAAGLRGVCRRKWITTTIRDQRVRPAEDLVHRQFAATAPRQLWVADITHIPTWAGVLYLAVVLGSWRTECKEPEG